MKQKQQPLSPKLSSVYNKILQLAIAVFLIVMVMNFWVSSRHEQQMQIQQHANTVGKMYLAQAATSVSPLLSKQPSDLQEYVDGLAQQPLVESVHVYGKTGQTIAASRQNQSIKDLFGLSPASINKSDVITPFVKELRIEALEGYIRLSLNRSLLTDDLIANSNSQYDIIRLLMIVAGIIGFLLTRGLNRFSRQGFRPPNRK